MDQLNIFGSAAPQPKLPPGLLQYNAGVFSAKEGLDFMRQFIETVPWQQRMITMYGKQLITPRLTAWYGDTGKGYTFSGSKFDPLPWTPELALIREKVEAIAGSGFNSVLLNYYRDGNDSVT